MDENWLLVGRSWRNLGMKPTFCLTFLIRLSPGSVFLNETFWDYVLYFREAAAGDEKQGSSIIMSTSFALKFWSNATIDVVTIPSFTLTASEKLLIKFDGGENMR